jgi:uncharacterized protein YhbP (UPF0306 family)
MELHREISDYIDKRFIVSLSVIHEDAPYSAPLFYVFDPLRIVLLFMSEKETNHARAILETGLVAGSISDCEREIRRVRGIQFRGIAGLANGDDESIILKYKTLYPESSHIKGNFFRVAPYSIKMSDNTVSFGFKRAWFDDTRR